MRTGCHSENIASVLILLLCLLSLRKYYLSIRYKCACCHSENVASVFIINVSSECYSENIASIFMNNTDIQNFTFLGLAETKCANSYVNRGAEHENHNKNASLATVFELSSLTCTTS